MTLRRLVIRAAGLAVLALAIGGPTPGYVGSCDPGGGSSSTTVDPHDFCVTRLTYQCARDKAAGRIMCPADPMAPCPAYNTCVASIANMCSGFNLPAGCMPSTGIAQACYDALLTPARLSTPCSLMSCGLSECGTPALCGGAPLEGI